MNMNIVRWDPFRELSQLFDRDAFAGANANGNVHRWQPLVDIRETKDAYRVEVELPAVDAKDVRIELKSGVLHVSGERRFANDEDGRVHRRERSYGKFTRSFRLPEDANPAAIDASAKDGVVSIAIGKVAEAQARTIEVEAA